VTPAELPCACPREGSGGRGPTATVIDNTDTPAATSNACMQPTCTAGSPSQTPLAAGEACTQNMGKECDGAGTCVECITASECPGTDGLCQTRTCTSGVCVISFKDAGTPTTSQVSG